MENILSLIGRDQALFSLDISSHEERIQEVIQTSTFLVIGAAGSIGEAVTKEIFKRNPASLHCVDINENNLVELVRDIRSSFGYIKGEFKTFVIDCGSEEFEALLSMNSYDFILNLSALKHVRSESDPLSLMRMVEVNIINTIKTLKLVEDKSIKKYFCVSTDKAANPVNMMGASKRIMEKFLMKHGRLVDISTARFANVAFSNGSLLDGFRYRMEKGQPLAAPSDILRYFITPQESGELCLMSCLFGESKDIFFPKLDESLHLIKFSDIAIKFLKLRGYTPYICTSEEEARKDIESFRKKNTWPCFFEESNTTGEKGFEEFFTEGEELDLKTYKGIGVVKHSEELNTASLENFEKTIYKLRSQKKWSKPELVELFETCLPNFSHNERGRFLDDKM
tara:strand:+ start:5937 stop:7124 length:1188 start_codon:yes stop_codon:yes gene_type:complete